MVLKGPDDEMFVVAAWSPDGEHVVVGSDEAIARVWEADGRGAPVVLKGHTDAILSAAWSPDGGAILTVSDDQTARVWDPEAGEAMVVLQGHTDAIVSAAWAGRATGRSASAPTSRAGSPLG